MRFCYNYYKRFPNLPLSVPLLDIWRTKKVLLLSVCTTLVSEKICVDRVAELWRSIQTSTCFHQGGNLRPLRIHRTEKLESMHPTAIYILHRPTQLVSLACFKLTNLQQRGGECEFTGKKGELVPGKERKRRNCGI